ncbi:hypothetical protein [Salimicrobium halophilum]|uniref:Uncharacterized protein n=1 Tax=Salimicrobium halophilum TaxID=86666 RepID=A0A1G8WF28_9BACI|nr:hypothetical protein [Salimicrobium halophilum]SDJ76295.1 hypothetical protein SAMN04490247_3133 [Salimicrobium halophilum]
MIFSDEETLTRTYHMKAKVMRWEEYTDGYETKQEEVTKYPDMPCTMQRSTRKNATRTEGPNEIEYDTVLLHPPGFMLKAGDNVTVTYKNGVTAAFEAGEPYFFETHHEVPLYREDEA